MVEWAPSAAELPVTIPYSSLTQANGSLTPLLQRAFSSEPTSLGLLVISDLPPEFAQLRHEILMLSNVFASLPEHIRERYTNPEASYLFGWSCAKEKMRGKPDNLKGSFYNNPTRDETRSLSDATKSDKNIWPNDAPGCERFERAFKGLCALLVQVGEKVGANCDAVFNQSGQKIAGTKTIKQLITQSESHKARLLHYFPREGQIFSLGAEDESRNIAQEVVDDSWCGTHIDHSLLTVLCPAMFLAHATDAEGNTLNTSACEIPSPGASTGLFIKTRAGQIVKANIPANCVAIQTGETLENLTASKFAATPHFVNSTSSHLNSAALERINAVQQTDEVWSDVNHVTITRETMAVFLQPNMDQIVSHSGETFAQFSKRVNERHY